MKGGGGSECFPGRQTKMGWVKGWMDGMDGMQVERYHVTQSITYHWGWHGF